MQDKYENKASGRGRRRSVTACLSAAAVLTLAGALAACGSDDSGSGSSTPASGGSSASTQAAGDSTKGPFDLSTLGEAKVPGKMRCGATATGDDPCLVPARPPAGKAIKIGFFGLSNNSYPEAALKQIHQVAEANNASVTEVLNNFNPAQQVRQLQDAVSANKYDAYIIMPENPPALKPLMQQITKLGKPYGTFVLTNGSDAQGNAKLQVKGQTIQMVLPTTIAGQNVGKETLEACKASGAKPCKVGFLRGNPVLPFEQIQVTEFKKVLKTDPNVQLVSTVPSNYDTATARKVTQNMLQAHSDINVIATLGDQISVGAVQGLTDAGKTPGKDVLVASRGAGTLGLDLMRQGKVFASDVVAPQNEGAMITTAIIARARGDKSFPDLGIDTTNTIGDLPPILSQTNKDKWKDYKGQWSAA